MRPLCQETGLANKYVRPIEKFKIEWSEMKRKYQHCQYLLIGYRQCIMGKNLHDGVCYNTEHGHHRSTLTEHHAY
jgi:hypothetical protein